MIKRLLSSLLLAIMVVSLLGGTALAYLYKAPVAITENSSTSYDMLPILWTQNNDWLADNGFMNSTANDTRVQTLGGLDKPWMVADNKTLTAIPVPADSQTNLYFTTGESEVSAMDIIVGYGGYITITDAAALEPDTDFEFEQKGWVDTSAGNDKNLVYKQAAFRTYITGTTNVTSAVLNTATANLVPDAVGTYTNITSVSGAATHWEAVDDPSASPDDITTYVYVSSQTSQLKDAYNLQDGSIPSDAIINSVTVYFRFRSTSAGTIAYCQPFLRLGADETTGTERSEVAVAWTTFSETLTRPGGGSWMLSDISSLQVAIGLKQANANNEAQCTQVYVGVNYTYDDVSVTATGVSSGEHTVNTSGNGETGLQLFVDEVLKDTSPLPNTGGNLWVQKAPQLGGETVIKSLAVYNNKLYGGTGDLAGALYEWNDVNLWVQVAPQLGVEVGINDLAVYNGKLYGGTTPNGNLYEWNDVNLWVQVAPQFYAQTNIISLAVYNGKLYGGTFPSGLLFEWNDVDAWTLVADQLDGELGIYSLAVYNDKLYGGTYNNGRLYEWNGVDAWVQVAPKLGAETFIESLAVYNGKLYGGTGELGKLYEWNDVDLWVEVAPQLGAETYIYELAVYNGKLYGGTGKTRGALYEWNGVNAWVEVAPKLGTQTRVYSLAVYNNKLYGGTFNLGNLYEWNMVISGVPDNANDWILNQNNVLPYMEYYKHTVGSTLVGWYQPNDIILTTVLPDRAGAAQDGAITWGSNPAGVGATIGSMSSSGQPDIGATSDTSTSDLLPVVGETDWRPTPGVSATLLANPMRPIVTAVSDNTTLSEYQVWVWYGIIFVVFITVLVGANVRGHHLITGVATSAAIILLVVWTIFPLLVLLIVVLAIWLGLVSERSPSL